MTPSDPRRDSQGAEQRSKITGYVTAGVLGFALVAVLILVVVAGGDEGSGTAASQTTEGFEPVYGDLDARREAAGVSTMGKPADAKAHLHPRLELWANGERILIPVSIGIDPSQSPDAMASLHTHESDGTIHVEGMSKATLGQFFEVWGVPFSDRQLGPYEAKGSKKTEMWVDGQPSTKFGALRLVDRQKIVVAYGTPEERAQAR